MVGSGGAHGYLSTISARFFETSASVVAEIRQLHRSRTFMLEQIAVGLGIFVLTTGVHAGFMVLGESFLNRRITRFGHPRHYLSKALLVSLLAAWMFLAVVTEGIMWAQVYLWNPHIESLPDAETAFYFSMVTYTSVGYGDIVLKGSWRMLASIQGANGVIIFGWTTALIFTYIQRVYGKSN